MTDARDARIALARSTIAQVIELADATLTGEHASAGDYPGCWCFTLQAGSFQVGVRLNATIFAALVAAFGDGVAHGSPVGGPGIETVGLYFHVPAGAS